MSGDVAGLGLGVIIAVSLIPVILTVAAGAAALVGTYYLGKGLLYGAEAIAEKRKTIKKVKPQNCSNDLASVYTKLQQELEQQSILNEKAISNLGEELERNFDPQRVPLNLDTPEIRKKVDNMKIQTSLLIDSSCKNVAAACSARSRRVSDSISKMLQSIQTTKSDLARWQEQDAASDAANLALAQEALRDAKSSLDLMRSLSQSYNSKLLESSYNVIANLYNNTVKALRKGNYQTAFANSHTIIRNVALEITDHGFRQLETDYYKEILLSKLEGLKEEMKARRTAPIKIRTTKNEDKTLDGIDLAKFMQGKYENLLQAVDTEISTVNAMTDVSVDNILEHIQYFDNDLQPSVRNKMDIATLKALGHEEKMHALEVITDYMNAQNYKLKWLRNPGLDLSQKTVVNFTRDATDTSVSVVIDTGDKQEEATNMEISVHTFSDTGSSIPPREQENLRNGMNRVLSDEGIGGNLRCDPDTLGMASHETDYNSEMLVQNMPVRQII